MLIQNRIRRSVRNVALVCMAAHVLLSRPVSAQEPAQTPPAAVDSAPTGPTVIVSAEISRQAQVDLTLLASLRSREDQALAIQRFADEIAANDSLVDTLQRETEEQIGDRQSMGRLETLRTQWLRVDGKWDDLSSRLQQRAEELQTDLDSIRAIRTRWQVTRDSIGELELPEALRNRIVEVLQDVETTEGTTRELLNGLLTLEDQVAELAAESTAQLLAIDEALSVARVRIVARDSRPIWSLLLHPPEDTPLFEQGESLFDELWQGAVEAVESDADPLIIHLLLTVVLLGWFVVQALRSRTWSTEDEGMLVARLVMGRPGAAVLLL
jgi:hypothetical protein